MTAFQSIVTGVAAATFALAVGAAEAQQKQELSKQQVESFFQDMGQTMTQAMRKGDLAKVVDWARTGIADGASFANAMEIYTGTERKGFVSMTLDKEDIVKVGSTFAGLLSGMNGNGIQDYALQIQVMEVTPIGADAATVRTEITESGRLALPQMADAQRQAGKQGAAQATEGRGQATGQSTEFKARADCTHLLRRAGGQELAIGLTNCQGEARFQAR